MPWKFVVTDLDGIQIGAVEDAYERKWSGVLNGLDQASFRVRLDNPLATEITDRDGDVLLKAYSGNTLVFFGELTTADETGPNYHRAIDRSALLNQAYSLGTDSTGTADVRAVTDATSIAARGLFEEVVSFTADAASLRQAYLREAVRVRKDPRVKVTYEPSSGEPGLRCNFAGPLWRLQKRLFNKASTDLTLTGQNSQIGWGLISAANLESATGIAQGTLGTTIEANQVLGAYKPVAECLTEMAEAKAFPFETPVTKLAQDDFQGGTQSGSIDGRVAPTGGTWEHFGSATSLHYLSDVDTRVFRSVSEDAGTGIYQVLNTVQTATALYVQAAHSFDAGPWTGYQGVVARYSGTTANIRATINPIASSTISVVKNGSTGLGQSAPIALTDIFYYSRLGIDAAGRWAYWFWPASESYPGAPVLTGQDSDLATGGPLATGKVGIYDQKDTGGSTIVRKYDNFEAGALTASLDWQSLDFELAPVEPTGNPPTIASFNASSRIGTTKANVIFDCGAGNTRTPTFLTDYIIGDTVTARGIYNDDARFNGLVRIFGVDVTIDENGKETVSPNFSPE